MNWEEGEELCLYFLTDPRDEAIRYVGVTCMPKKREHGHCSPLLVPGKKEDWVRGLLREGLRPRLDVLCWGSVDEMVDLEELLVQVIPGVLNFVPLPGTHYSRNRKTALSKVKEHQRNQRELYRALKEADRGTA